MRIRWFGKSWGAPICEAGYEVEPPVGQICLSCREWIYANERGVVMAASQEIEGSFLIYTDDPWYNERRVCAYHIDCFIESILPDVSTVARIA